MWKKPHIPKLGTILKKATTIARVEAVKGLHDWAEEQKTVFVEKIESQTFASFQRIYYPDSGTNLSPRWLRRKELAGADLRTMIATGHYIASIKVWKKGSEKKGPIQFRIGFNPKAQARKLDGSVAPILLQDLARVHEFGSMRAHIPPRPHWGPHGNVMRREAPKTARSISTRILKRLKRSLVNYAQEAS